MTPRNRPELVRSALVQRLTEAARVLMPERPSPQPGQTDEQAAAELLDALVRDLRQRRDPSELWLLFVALSTVFPTPQEFQSLARTLELTDQVQSTLALLTATFELIETRGAPDATMRLVTDEALVDVDFASQHNLHAGIQRVVRSTVPLWHGHRPIVMAAWTKGFGAYRQLDATETARVVAWGDDRPDTAPAPEFDPDAPPSSAAAAPVLLVPWRTSVVLAEVPSRDACERLSAVGQFSGNAVTAIGYDCIPIVSADLLPVVEPNRFVHYLSLLKYAHGIAGISVSATAEFAGFTAMLPAQGLTGPAVVKCSLPAPAGTAATPYPFDGRKYVASVGSFEPRKNQMATLYAAEILWREGLRFDLVLIGAGGSSRETRRRVNELRRKGRPVDIRTGVSEAELSEIYAGARFTVFTSLHEGYGLPVAESLALGTPVLTTGYGSTAEIAADGGAVLVNPRSDAEIIDAMRRLITDDAEIARLRTEIAGRPDRTWQHYADELWDDLVAPAMADAAAPVARVRVPKESNAVAVTA